MLCGLIGKSGGLGWVSPMGNIWREGSVPLSGQADPQLDRSSWGQASYCQATTTANYCQLSDHEPRGRPRQLPRLTGQAHLAWGDTGERFAGLVADWGVEWPESIPGGLIPI